jgi:hypothetical protein
MKSNNTPVKAIRAYCMDCSNSNVREIRLCPMEDCPLYPYRLGKNPNIILSESAKQKRAETLKNIRNS